MSVYINYKNTTCISLQGLTQAGWDKLKPTKRPDGRETYQLWCKWMSLAKQRNATRQAGGNGRQSLIAFEAIPENYRDEISEKFGNPTKQASNNSFVSRILPDENAARFFLEYKIDTHRYLPKEHQQLYTANACVLNAIKILYTNQQAARAALGSQLKNFWKGIAEVLNNMRGEFNHSLRKNPVALQRQYNAYIKLGYESLISGKFCNPNSTKITPEIQAWIIKEMSSTRQSIEMVAMRYPAHAEKMGWRTDISVDAFKARAAKQNVRAVIDYARYGAKKFREKHGHYHAIAEAKYSNDIWMGDGTGTGFCYRTADNKIGYATSYFVMDAKSKKFLSCVTWEGIGGEDRHRQAEAFRAAARNTGYCKPYQIKVDHQKGHQTTEMRTLFNQLAHVVTFSRPHRSSGRSIERTFGMFQEMMLSQYFFWSGFGRHTHSTINHAPNNELMVQNLDKLPSYEELLKLMDVTVAEWNNLDYKGRENPNKVYAESLSPEQQVLTLDEIGEMFFTIQGPKEYGNSGILLRHKDFKQLYEVYDADGNVDYNFRNHYLHQSLYLRFDPELEFKDIDLLVLHGTGGYQKVATASPKRTISESVKYHAPGDVSWGLKQMDLEEEYMQGLEKELVLVGHNDESLNDWRKKITIAKELNEEEGEEDIDQLFKNRQ